MPITELQALEKMLSLLVNGEVDGGQLIFERDGIFIKANFSIDSEEEI